MTGRPKGVRELTWSERAGIVKFWADNPSMKKLELSHAYRNSTRKSVTWHQFDRTIKTHACWSSLLRWQLPKKRSRRVNNPSIEAELAAWVDTYQERGGRLSYSVLIAHAVQIVKRSPEAVANCQFSQGWAQMFFQRHGFKYRMACGEAGLADHAVSEVHA